MSDVKTLFINRLTTVDCAILLGNFKANEPTEMTITPTLMGFSFNVSVEVEGLLDKEENVIVDFGKLKKDLKAWTDGKGPDHKLICTTVAQHYRLENDDQHKFNIKVVRADGQRLMSAPHDAFYQVQSPELDNVINKLDISILRAFTNSQEARHDYLVFSHNSYLPEGLQLFLKGMEKELKDYYNQEINFQYNRQRGRSDNNLDRGIKVTRVVCDIQHTVPAFFSNAGDRECSIVGYASAQFPYTHGLKKSTSYGCKNIAHGHLSYIALYKAEMPTYTGSSELHRAEQAQSLYVKLDDLAQKIADRYFNVHFIHRENVGDKASAACIKEVYTADKRGIFEFIALSENALEKLKFGDADLSYGTVACPKYLDEESTIENLVDLIFNEFEKELREVGVEVLYVSEGLHKGSYRTIKY